MSSVGSIRGVLPCAVPEPLLEVDAEHDRALGIQVIRLFDARVVANPSVTTLPRLAGGADIQTLKDESATVG